MAICADSHAETLVKSIDADFAGRLSVDVATLPHHGSSANMSPDLAERLQSKRWVISTNGGRGATKKPNRASVARVLTAKARNGNSLSLIFNCDHEAAKLWDDAEAEFDYCVRYPAPTEDWISVRLER